MDTRLVQMPLGLPFPAANRLCLVALLGATRQLECGWDAIITTRTIDPSQPGLQPKLPRVRLHPTKKEWMEDFAATKEVE